MASELIAGGVPCGSPEINDTWDDPDVVLYNRCYNYACNVRSDGMPANPGQSSGYVLQRPLNCADVKAAATLDGLIPVDCDAGCDGSICCHLVALAISPDPANAGEDDYHWYRLDRNGTWSQKIGVRPFSQVDNSGNPIVDPRTADRGPYTIFCGCFCVPCSCVPTVRIGNSKPR